MSVSGKTAVLVVAPYGLIEVYDCPDGGCSKDLCNIGRLLSGYMTVQPRKQPSSICTFVLNNYFLNQTFWWLLCDNFVVMYFDW